MAVTTLAQLFLHAAGHRKPDALLHKVGGTFHPISTAELVDRVRRLSRGLEKRGVERGDRVALMAKNGPHWPIVDFATLCRGAATVTVYPTLPADQAAYILADSESKIAFVHDPDQLTGLLELRDGMPSVELFVLIRGELPVEAAGDDGVITMAALDREGEDVDPEAFGDQAHAVEPADLATLVYTSGTTGKPKGVMLSHENIVSNVHAARGLFPIDSTLTALCFLPLAHAYERMVDFLYFHQGTTVAYESHIAEDLGLVRPHVFVSVPRIYEKLLARIQENVARGSATQRKIFDWAVEVGQEALPWRLKRQRPPGLLGVKLALADRLVFSKLRDRIGGRFEFALSGGAPLTREVAAFFWGAGIEIYEGYGLTETSPVIAVNTPGAARIGTVGLPLPGVEVRIAEDGEILSRGPNTMRGYYGKPEETAEVIDADGWFHTGDIGEIDDDGYLSITDRKKEIIVNAYGKNVAPTPIENALKASRFVSQVVVIGDRRKFLSALIVPDFAALEAWASEHPDELPTGDPEALVEDERVRGLIAAEVRSVNEDLARYEQIVAWDLLPEELTIEGGELTPTQKVKRRVVDEKHQDRIDAMYARAAAEQ